MEPQTTVSAAAPAAAAEEPSMSVFQRAIAVFTRPASAWQGLRTHAQWWFPMVVLVILGALFALALHQRAILPMIQETWDQAVADGKMTAEQVDRMSAFMGGPAGLAISVVQTVIAVPLLLLLTSLLVWFAVAFLLGTKFGFRLALETVCWASLVSIPAQILTGVIAWSHETMKGIHIGFGILVPESDPATKLQTALGFFLDRIGPFGIWAVVVMILGAAALSGAPRKRVVWAVGGLYLGVMACIAVIMAMVGRGS